MDRLPPCWSLTSANRRSTGPIDGVPGIRRLPRSWIEKSCRSMQVALIRENQGGKEVSREVASKSPRSVNGLEEPAFREARTPLHKVSDRKPKGVAHLTGLGHSVAPTQRERDVGDDVCRQKNRRQPEPGSYPFKSHLVHVSLQEAAFCGQHPTVLVTYADRSTIRGKSPSLRDSGGPKRRPRAWLAHLESGPTHRLLQFSQRWRLHSGV